MDSVIPIYFFVCLFVVNVTLAVTTGFLDIMGEDRGSCVLQLDFTAGLDIYFSLVLFFLALFLVILLLNSCLEYYSILENCIPFR